MKPITRKLPQDLTETETLVLPILRKLNRAYTITLETEGYGEGETLLMAEGLSYGEMLNLISSYHEISNEWSDRMGEQVFTCTIDSHGAYIGCTESQYPERFNDKE